MTEKPVTLIISDLHIGGGSSDDGDDHIFHKNQFVEFLREQAATPDGAKGQIDLFVNGDFLEFAQTAPEAFTLVSQDGWCTEEESLKKLDVILKGHPEIFQALAEFQRTGNSVTLAAGNHDVDLFWGKVQERLSAAAGRVSFEVGNDWVARYAGKLQISHGHLGDVANTFSNWQRPFVKLSSGEKRLEMCPGTLFMVKFVNALEKMYPFADNLLPVTKLASVLLSDDKAGFVAVGWLFAQFVGTTNLRVLGSDFASTGERLLAGFQHSPRRLRELSAAIRALEGEEGAVLMDGPLTEEQLIRVMMFLLGRIELAKWQELFRGTEGIALGTEGVTLSAIGKSNFVDGKERCRKEATKRAKATGATVVVMGHTHQPDEYVWEAGGVYYNPGSWTRYLELSSRQKVTLADLKDETKYPYKLNYVRIENTGGDLRSEMICFESDPGR